MISRTTKRINGGGNGVDINRNNNTKENFTSKNRCFPSVVLLATILAHAWMISFQSLKLIVAGGGHGNIRCLNNKYNGVDEDEKGVLIGTMSTTRATPTNNTTKTIQMRTPYSSSSKKLPHWRLATDCSVYHLDCISHAKRNKQYLPYPFPSRSDDDGIQIETFDSLPDEWKKQLNGTFLPSMNTHDDGDDGSAFIMKSPLDDRHYLYPPSVSEQEYQSCLHSTIHGNKSTLAQLDELLLSDHPRITPEPDTNMVAFTISDYSYVHDMLHDVFQMMDDIVGFSSNHFFLVAIDIKTVHMACRYGYPVIFWRDDETNLRDAVANTKLIVSSELARRHINFFFSEMDVWWIQSPKPSLVDFQQQSDHDRYYLYLSGHQNNPTAPNIGVYAVMANNYTEEYFQVCLDVLKERPETHDQLVMAEVHRLFEYSFHNRTYNLGGPFKPGPPPVTPKVRHPFPARYWTPHEIVADERPRPTHETLAIHTLNSSPLQYPHGKKMMARELGVYYGFQSMPLSGRGSKIHDSAGYYMRSGRSHRRYMWLDGPILSNFYSTAPLQRYHDKHTLQWTMAFMIAVASRTDRILILPQVYDADIDSGSYFLWHIMDYSKVDSIVDFRETNFPSNPKAWTGNDDLPFGSVATTAMMHGEGQGGDGITIYAEVSQQSSSVMSQAWRFDGMSNHEWMDAYLGALLSVPEIINAEVLLVNPAILMDSGFAYAFGNYVLTHDEERKNNESTFPRLGTMEEEMLEMYNLLGWCWDSGMRHTVSKSSASDSCYGIGGKGH